MIIDKKVEVNGYGKNIEYYNNLGYKMKRGEKTLIRIQDLKKGSNVKINIKCSNCETEKIKQFNNYNNIISKNKENKYYCIRCKNILAKQTCLERYGVDNVMKAEEIKNKLEETNQKKYGCKSSLQNEKIKEKTKKTLLDKYGVDNIAKLKETQDKINKTNQERYGVNRPLQNETILKKLENKFYEKFSTKTPLLNDVILNKISETNLEKYGYSNPMKSDIIRNKVKLKTKEKYSKIKDYKFIKSDGVYYHLIHKICGEKFQIKSNKFPYRLTNDSLCVNCFPEIKNVSNVEKSLLDYISTITDNITPNDRTVLNGKELDIYLPELNIAIEFNGLYWHSDKFVDKDYHLNKTIECKKKDIDLIHIFEDDWKHNKDIIKSLLWSKINHAKKIEINEYSIKKTSIKNTKIFLKENHIKGYIKSNYILGLYTNNTLESVMCFNITKNDISLTQFCDKKYSKYKNNEYILFTHFINNNKPKSISYIRDLSFIDNNICETIDFIFSKNIQPKPYHIIKNKKETYLKGEKYNIIYDCGYDLYIFNF